IELEIADDRHARSRVTFELQREQLGRSLMAVDDAEYRSRIDRDGFWLGAAIEHGRDDAVAAQALGQLLAGALTARNRQFLRLHVRSFRRTGSRPIPRRECVGWPHRAAEPPSGPAGGQSAGRPTPRWRS